MSATLSVFVAFLRLGFTSFGGPIAHLGYFRRAFVEQRRWLDDAAFAELVALCQFLPGPTSSQVGFLIGQRRAGWAGALAAWLGFTAPSALFMYAAAVSARWFETLLGQAIAHGLQIAAFAIVAQALCAMARALPRRSLWALAALALALILILPPQAWTQAGVIALCAALAMALPAPRPVFTDGEPQRAGAAPWFLLALFAVLLIALPLLAPHAQVWALAAACYRAGALVFGGGHVVLPLLEADFVGRAWISRDAFLAGYGAAQIAPGPLFAFATFLGAVQSPAPHGPLGALIATIAIFLPGLLLAAAAAPLWRALRIRPLATKAAAGAGAAAVGVLAAALITLVAPAAILSWFDFALGLAGLAVLLGTRAPPWAVVAAVTAASVGARFAGLA